MARPLRIEYPGAVYHITSRGNAKSAIFIDDLDRIKFLESLESTVTKYNWLCHAYCLMGNHYHLLIETIDPNLSLGMRQLNGVYTQAFNRHHNRVGHVFQGRFKSILVEKESYLLELCRYIVRNPLRAGMVQNIADWKWSSYHATATGINKPEFLSVNWVLRCFTSNPKKAKQQYRDFVESGITTSEGNTPWKNLTSQIFLGGADFIQEMQERVGNQIELSEIPRVQRWPGRPTLNEIFNTPPTNKQQRNEGMAQAHLQHGYTLKEIGNHLGLHYSTVSRGVVAHTKIR